MSAAPLTHQVTGPFGALSLAARGGRLVSLRWRKDDEGGCAGARSLLPGADAEVLQAAEAQLAAYGAGQLRAFDLPLALGEGFRARFLQALIDIPFGETRRYGELAKRLGVSAQAIGQACGANPIPIIIPCHRVLGAKGLGGFSGGTGVETKVALLRHEGAAGLLL